MRLPVLLLSLFLVLVFVFSPGLLWAQFTIQGQVKDMNGSPIVLPTAVLLYSSDSSLYKAEMGDTSGHFSVGAARIANLFLKIMAPGYFSSSLPFADTVTRSQTLDVILQPQDKELKVVSVTAMKPLVEHRADRTIFNVESSIASIGGDVLDALKKAPGVRVTNDDISIIGKSGASVMINGKLVQLSGDELISLLRSMAADQVSRIEIITAPPARYDAEGNSGIINIVTKKGGANGLNGNIKGQFVQNSLSSLRTDGSVNFRRDRLNIYGNESACRNYSRPSKDYTTYFPGQRWEQTSRERTFFPMGRYQLGADYSISPNAVIGFLYTYGSSKPEYDELIVANAIRDNNTLDSVIRTVSHTDDGGVRNVANINYEWNIDTTGKKLNIDLDYFTRTANKTRNYDIRSFFAGEIPTGFQTINRTSGRQLIDIRTAKLDLDWPSRLAKFSFGGKLSFIHNTSDNLAGVLDGSGYVNDPSRSNSFDYKENTQSLYFSANKSLNKWEIQLGLRGEYTETDGIAPTLGERRENDYFKLFPSFYVQFDAGENHRFNFNYTRRIGRPPFWLLNPFRYYYTQDSYEEGNPFLQPSFSNNLDLSYTLKSRYSFSVYADIVEDYFTRVSVVDTLNKALYFIQSNSGREFNYGFKAEANFTITPWWECNAGFYGFCNKYVSSFYDASKNTSTTRPTCYISSDNSFILNSEKTWMAELNAWYMARSLDDFDLLEPYYSVSMGIKTLLLHKKLVLTLNAEDIFKTDINTTRNLSNGTRQSHYYDDRSVSCSLTWKFGNRSIKAKRDRKGGMEEEGGRTGG